MSKTNATINKVVAITKEMISGAIDNSGFLKLRKNLITHYEEMFHFTVCKRYGEKENVKYSSDH